MAIRYAHTNIVSTDWKRLVAFYTKVFNCHLVPPIRKQSGEWWEKGTGLGRAALEGAHLALPGYGTEGPTLEIYQYAEIDPRALAAPNSRGFGHIAFEVDDIDGILKLLLEEGGAANGQITEKEVAGVGIIRFIYARDPEGNLIELQSWSKPESDLSF